MSNPVQVPPATNRNGEIRPENQQVIERCYTGNTTLSPLLLRRLEVAALLNVGGRTFDRLISTGKFPTADICVNDKLIRWRRSTVESWVANGGKM